MLGSWRPALPEQRCEMWAAAADEAAAHHRQTETKHQGAVVCADAPYQPPRPSPRRHYCCCCRRSSCLSPCCCRHRGRRCRHLRSRRRRRCCRRLCRHRHHRCRHRHRRFRHRYRLHRLLTRRELERESQSPSCRQRGASQPTQQLRGLVKNVREGCPRVCVWPPEWVEEHAGDGRRGTRHRRESEGLPWPPPLLPRPRPPSRPLRSPPPPAPFRLLVPTTTRLPFQEETVGDSWSTRMTWMTRPQPACLQSKSGRRGSKTGTQRRRRPGRGACSPSPHAPSNDGVGACTSGQRRDVSWESSTWSPSCCQKRPWGTRSSSPVRCRRQPRPAPSWSRAPAATDPRTFQK